MNARHTQTSTKPNGHGNETRHIRSILTTTFLGLLGSNDLCTKDHSDCICTHFLSTLKLVAGLPAHTTITELLIALNKVHPLDGIQKVYKSIYTQLADWNLIDELPIIAKPAEEAFHKLFPD